MSNFQSAIYKDKRDYLSNELKKWDSIEQMAFLLENLNNLPFNLVKLVNSYCIDLIDKKSSSPTHLNGAQTSNSSSSNLRSTSPKEIDECVVLEEQANDLSIK
jgi:hypothetical protein